MLEIPADDQLNNKENIVLRSLAGDPNRHTPLADHYPLSDFATQEKPAVDMYTLETRYQPIPSKALPKTNDPRIYYVDSDRRTPIPMQSEQPAVVPAAFLEPKVISQPILYSVGNTRTGPVPLEQPIPMDYESTPPTVYSIVGRPRRPTVDMSSNNLEIPNQANNKAPTIYSVVGSQGISNPNEQPINQSSQFYEEPANQYVQPSANFYSLIGSPARTSRGVQVNTLDSDEPSPILYTIVGDTPIQTSRLNEKNSSPTRKPPTDVAVYTLGNQANALRAQEQEQSMQKPSLYALVDRSYSPPPQEKRAKPSGMKKNPSPPTTTTVTTTRRSSRSLEQKSEPISDEMISYPVIKSKQQTLPKESKLSKSETTFIPVHGDEHRTRPPPPFQTNPKPYTMAQYPPLQLSDYRTHKAYRERKFNNNPLPVIGHNHSDRKTRPALYEPRYRVEKHHPFTSTKPTSLERYPVNMKTQSSLWDNGYQTQTDDDEEYEQKMNRKKRNFKTSRPRAPWIPVW